MSEREIASLPADQLATGLKADAEELEDIASNRLDHGDEDQFRAADAMMRAAHDMRGVASKLRDTAPTDEPVSEEGEKIGPPHVTAVERARDAAQQFGDDDESNVEARLLSDVLHFLQAWTDPDRPTHADARSEISENRAPEIAELSDREITERLCGAAHTQSHYHACLLREAARRLSDRHEPEGDEDE